MGLGHDASFAATSLDRCNTKAAYMRRTGSAGGVVTPCEGAIMEAAVPGRRGVWRARSKSTRGGIRRLTKSPNRNLINRGEQLELGSRLTIYQT